MTDDEKTKGPVYVVTQSGIVQEKSLSEAMDRVIRMFKGDLE